MSLFDWFSSRKKHEHHSYMPSSGLSRLESTKPANGHHQHGSNHGRAQPANRKQERLERREVLYGIVRECMTRAGVLSSSYKFKVLSLDSRGQQFLVMVDLAYGGGADTNRLAEIEAMVAQTAKSRHDVLVTAVYWRANNHVAVGDPLQAPQRPPISRPAPLMETPAPQAEMRVPPTRSGRVDPLQKEEVTAFKQALSAGLRGEEALSRANQGKPQPHAQPQSYTLLTGFEDTEMADGSSVDLGGTQYGALR
jgi:hypothetical protein